MLSELFILMYLVHFFPLKFYPCHSMFSSYGPTLELVFLSWLFYLKCVERLLLTNLFLPNYLHFILL